MNRYLNFITISLIALFFSACGGGSGDTLEGGNNIADSNTTVSITAKRAIVDCNNSNSDIGINDCGNEDTPDYYTCLESNDTIIKDNNNTTIQILHDIDDNKKVCVQSGSAYVLK